MHYQSLVRLVILTLVGAKGHLSKAKPFSEKINLGESSRSSSEAIDLSLIATITLRIDAFTSFSVGVVREAFPSFFSPVPELRDCLTFSTFLVAIRHFVRHKL